MTQGIVVSAKEDLEDRWRWQYDILVYPKESQEYQGLGYGWVAPQTSIASYGGISMAELETIRQVSGVEVAAPLSLLGYFNFSLARADFTEGELGKVYEIQHVQKAFDGLRNIQLKNTTRYSEYVGNIGYGKIPLLGDSDRISYSEAIVPSNEVLRYPNEVLLVAIDPEEEAQLYHLSEAIVEGNDLFEAEVKKHSNDMYSIPIIALRDQGLQVKEIIEVSEVEIPEVIDVSQFDSTISYLRHLPKTQLAHLEVNPYSSEIRYRNVRLNFGKDGFKKEEPQALYMTKIDYTRYAPIYFEIMKQEEGIPFLYVEGQEVAKNPYMGEQDDTYSYRQR